MQSPVTCGRGFLFAVNQLLTQCATRLSCDHSEQKAIISYFCAIGFLFIYIVLAQFL